MEIRIRTAAEFHASHVTIEIRAEDQDEAARVAERLAGPGYWATAAERAERRVRELEEERAGDAGTIEGLRDRLADVEATLLTAHQAREIETRRAQEYDRDRHTERDRADRAEADLKDLKARTAVAAEELARYRRAHVCTVECTENAHTAFQGRTLVTELEQELAAEREVISRLEADLRRVREEIGRRFTTAQVEDAKAGAREDARAEVTREKVQPLELELAALADLLGKVNGVALGSEVRRALEYLPAEPGTYAHTVSVALRRVRELLGVTWGASAPREV